MKIPTPTPIMAFAIFSAQIARCTPTVGQIMADIQGNMRPDHSTFWAADDANRIAADAFAQINGHMTIRQSDPSGKYRSGDDDTISAWSRAYARLSSGTGFVFWKDLGRIPEAIDEFWNAEFEEMEESGNMFEIIQVDRNNAANFVQIYPYDLRGEDTSACTWTACGVNTCATGDSVTHSMYGTDISIGQRCAGAPTAANARTLCCSNLATSELR